MAPDGWIATSDHGSLDASGNLTITGRTDDAYIRGGYNVQPSKWSGCCWSIRGSSGRRSSGPRRR
ncbi:hypothetical protein BJF79_09105 [Actinomadura sp. CNU-125]|nr:hypothetical protein BJF79_09105 [Actinomadura sp. CNU-125]